MSSESTESGGLIDLLAWVESNKQALTGGAVLVVAAGFIGYFMQWNVRQKEETASTALYDARVAAGESEADTVDAGPFLEVAQQHGGTAAGSRALLYSAEAYFGQGEYDKALAQFEAYQREYSDSPLISTAFYGVAACQESLGHLSEAMDTYKRVTTLYANTYVAHQAKIALAGLLEADGKPDQALALYDELSGPTISETFATRAAEAREALLKAHPELAPAADTASTAPAPSLEPSLTAETAAE